MQNKVTSTLKDETLVSIESLQMGQLFYWTSVCSGKMLGIRALVGGVPYGIMLSAGTYLTGDSLITLVPAGTTVQIVAG